MLPLAAFENWKTNVSQRARLFPGVNFVFDLFSKASTDYIGLLAAGVAYYFLLAVFPAIAAAISLYGLVTDPHSITRQFNDFSYVVPREVYTLLIEQAEKVANAHGGILSLGIIIGMAVAFYGSSMGVKALIKGFDIIYSVKRRRNLLALNATVYVLTFTMMLYLLIALTLVAGVPLLMNFFFAEGTPIEILSWVRWPILFSICVLGLDILYHFGPSHELSRWRWGSRGAFVATILWLCSSFGLSMFVSRMSAYNEIYGSLGTVIALMLWLWISALMILFGAEINALHARKGQGKLKAGKGTTA